MTVKIKVDGKVQGVYYRASTQQRAISLGLTGYVMNVVDGSVCIIASGEKSQIDDLLLWCASGSELSRVDHIHYEYIDEKRFSSFEIRR